MYDKYRDSIDIISNSDSSYEKIEKALLNIGKDFGLTEEDFKKDIVTRENLFTNPNEVIVLD